MIQKLILVFLSSVFFFMGLSAGVKRIPLGMVLPATFVLALIGVFTVYAINFGVAFENINWPNFFPYMVRYVLIMLVGSLSGFFIGRLMFKGANGAF